MLFKKALTGSEIVELIFRKLTGGILARISGTAGWSVHPLALIRVPFTDGSDEHRTGPGYMEYGSFIPVQMRNAARWAFALGRAPSGCPVEPYANDIVGLEIPPAEPDAGLGEWFRQELRGEFRDSLVIGLNNGGLLIPKWLFDMVYWTALEATMGTTPPGFPDHTFKPLAPNPAWRRKTPRVLARKIRDRLAGRVFRSWI